VLGADSTLQPGCGAALWQNTGELRRWEPALLIKRRLPQFFRYLVLDEAHETKGPDTAQGHAAGALAAACGKVIALTGTLIGGYAEHLRPLLFRLAPGSLVSEGLTWEAAMPFNERYGRVETRITERSGGRQRDGADNRQSRGASRSKTRSVRPGVAPTLFGKHLIDKAVFLSLAEVADGLPPLAEECIPVEMDAVVAAEYGRLESELSVAIQEMVRRGDRRLLGPMLQTLLAYPDLPYGWGPVGYREKGEGGGEGAFVTVCTPADLDPETIRPKEGQLIELCQAEKAAGRQVWVFVQGTDKHDVQSRLQTLLLAAGLKVGSLRSNVSLAKREEWIAKNGPKVDCVISHPRLVETGLDLFDAAGRYDFATLVFHASGYNLFTLRQAARRAWRIGQTLPCRVVYLYYGGTMQARAMALMGKKLAAAQALEGRFGADGLVALAGEDGGSVEMELARSLAERLDEAELRRTWRKVAGTGRKWQKGVKRAA
jgi:hypothetical protein